MFFGGLWLIWALLWSLVPFIALVLAVRARAEVRALAARVAALEAELAALKTPRAGPPDVPLVAPPPAGATATEASPVVPPPVGHGPFAAPPAPATAAPAGAPASAVPLPARAPKLDLEQRIGARWATWVGIVAIVFAASFLLRWAFEANLIGPGLRVTLGLVAGAVLLVAGLALHRRLDVPYLSEGLAGGGLGILYLSLYAGYDFYDFLSAGLAFAAMFVVTLAGALVAVLSGRQATAVLSLLGGLLTPVLLASDAPDERVLLGYLFVLDLSVLAVARFRTWPALNWLAWLGTAALAAPSLARDQEPPHLLARLALLSAIFLLFLAVPLAREWSVRSRERDLDLLLVAANAAGYFGAVYWTLEAARPAAEAPYAMGLAVLYATVAAEFRRRVPDDDTAVLVHLGTADVFLTLGIALAIDGAWVTLAWAAQGVVLLSAAPRVVTPAPAWGGVAALILAAVRAVALDSYWYPELLPRLTPTDVVHVAVVGCLVWAGLIAPRVRPDQLRLVTPHGLRASLWIIASVVSAVLIWRETTGLWPAMLLAALALALAAIARALPAPRAPTFAVALPLVALVLLVRIFADDAGLAREAATTLVNGTLLLRIAECAALLVAGLWLAHAEPQEGEIAGFMANAVAATAGISLLAVLSIGWTDYQGQAAETARGARRGDLIEALRWRTQIGLSVLWAVYAGAALGWGFRRRAPAVRYAGLALLAVVVVKAFAIDLSAVATVYRIVSFLVVGVVLLAVSLLYQKARRGA